MSRPVLFLDIDGVLNSLRYLKNNPGAFDPVQGPRSIDPEAAGRLNSILERTNAMVVVTSTWRLSYSIKRLESLLRSRGCPAIKIAGFTGKKRVKGGRNKSMANSPPRNNKICHSG